MTPDIKTSERMKSVKSVWVKVLSGPRKHVFLSALATLSLATVAGAQISGQEPGRVGGMMDEGWGWGMGHGMGGYGWTGTIVVALVVLGIAVMAFRRRNP